MATDMKRNIIPSGGRWFIGIVLCISTAAGTHLVDRGLRRGPRAVETLVDDSARPVETPWMLSTWRLSKGNEIHVSRAVDADGGVRLVIDDGNGFSWDTVTLDLAKDALGKIRSKAKVDWTKDFGPPFDGSFENVEGHVELSSADIANAHPLDVEYELSGSIGNRPVCEHGHVVVP